MLEAAFYLGSAFWLGALHAATPGHGKTVAAAYLVGNRGRVVDAVTLGLIVTLSHTGGIVLFGLLATLGSSALLPRQAEGWLALGTGALIVLLGLWMLWSQRRELPWSRTVAPRNTLAAIAGGSEGDHVHAPDVHADDRQYSTVGELAPSTPHAHSHGPDEKDLTPPAPGQADHGHSTGLHRHGWGRAHRHDVDVDDARRPSFALLLGLGVAGGVMPDPAALAVLLSATANGKLVLGLATVLVFSLGFASVLVVVGLVAARAGRAVLLRVGGRTSTLWVRLLTSVIVVGVGVVLTVGAWRTLAILSV